MRYYVLRADDGGEISCHILAEVVHDLVEDPDDRSRTLASAIAGSRTIIATREELLADPLTRHALAAWEASDDAEFDRESALLGDLPAASIGDA